MRGNRAREHQCGSALRSSLPSTPPSPGHRPGVCPARCCGPASQAEAGRVAPAPLDTVNSREPRRTLAFPPRLDAVNSPRGITSRRASPWHPVPTQQPQGRHEQCRAGGKRKLKGAEGRSWCAMPVLLRVAARCRAAHLLRHVRRPPCHLARRLVGAASAKPSCIAPRQRRQISSTREGRVLKPLSSPALQNQLQVFAGPVRQKTVSVLAEEMYPLTTTNTGHGHDSP